MITLHESNITTFPQDNGIGVLRDVIRAYAEEELNGMFEFYMEYDSEGYLVDELKEERIIKAKAQDKLGYQLFRIYSITKNHENDNLIIRAQHITYDLADNFVESLVANNLTKKQVMELIGSSTVLPHPFNVTSTNTTTRSSTRLYRTNPLQMVGGIEGSILQIWGGQIERDNFNLILHDRRGSDDGVKVTYEKNITGLTAEFDIGNLVTRIFPFVYIEETDNEPARLITVSGKYIDSPLINNYEKIYIEPIDYSSDERIDIHEKTDAQIRQQLEIVASTYFEETGNDKRKATMEVQFEHLWETEEYKDLAVLELVGMGDTVTIEHSRLKVDATAIVNYIRYDCIAEKNEEVRLGSVKARLTDNVNKTLDVVEKVEQAQQTANQAIKTANGKNTIYYGPDEPTNGIEGDLWFRVVDGEYTRTYRHDGIQWQLVLSVDVRDAIDEAQQAKDDAQQAVDRANQATQQATNAINQAQTAFDEAQQALSTASNALDVADDALTTAQSAIDTASHAASVAESANELAELLQTTVNGHTTAISNIENELSLKMNTVDADNKYATQLQLTATSSSLSSQITSVQGDVDNLQTNFSSLSQTVSSLTTRVGDAEGNITALQQTSVSLAGRLSDAEGNITTLTATVNGLQTTVSNVQGDVSSVTQLANALQTRMTNAEGDISTLTQTASSLQSVIEGMGTENNIIPNGSFENGELGWILHSRATIYIGDSKHGSNSLRIVGGSGTISQRLTLNTVPVEPGHTYKIEYWVKTSSDFNGVSGNNKLRLGYSSNETSAVHYSVGWTGPLTEWTKMESIWTVPNDVTRITPTIVSNHTQGWVLWDNIVVRDINDIKDMATQSQITQLSNAINLRVMKGDVINQINISDESILIDGHKVHITGQTTIDNGVIKSAHIQSLDAGKITTGTLDAGKVTLINLVGLDIYGSRFRSESGTDFMEITGGNIRLQQANGRYVTMMPEGIYGYYAAGTTMFQADRNLVTSQAFGTTEQNVYLAAFNEIRAVNYNDVPGDGQIGSYRYLPIRANGIYANFINVNSGGTGGQHVYLRPRADGEVRATVNETTDSYVPVKASGFIGDTLDIHPDTASNNLYIRPRAGYEVRFTSTGSTTAYQSIRGFRGYFDGIGVNSGNNLYLGANNEVYVTSLGMADNNPIVWRPLRAAGIHANYIDTNGATNATHIYVRPAVNGEARVTVRGGTDTYRPIRASSFPTASLAEYKQDIKVWEGNALDIINSATIYDYMLNSDVESGKLNRRYGLVVGEGYNTPSEVIDGDGVEQYLMNSISWKAIQELSSVFNKHDDEINYLKLKVQLLEQKVEQLEEMVA